MLPAAEMVPANGLGLRVARGFRMSLFADTDVAPDIYSMTLDSRGNVVVSSQGYIRTLFDSNNDGRADSYTDFASTGSGAMGMCFYGQDLFVVGDGGLWLYRDADGNGVADGGPERIIELNHAEHGGHAIRKGPDGWWYVGGGNETKFTEQHVTLSSSPVKEIEAGAFLRLPPEGGGCEAIAHGFRNPYDFDFNFAGDMFTYDSDGEREFLLPWYVPTRLYHVAQGGHHGWRLGGWQRSFARFGYYVDTVDLLAPTGRGSPTGLTVYRHYQFPPLYRNGLFFCDWTFGRVYFAPMRQNGSTYTATPDVFIEPIGTQGFAPTDVVVSRDGSLLVSTGGRKTRGGVYRVVLAGGATDAFIASNWWATVYDDLEAVLTAPQPLDAWSRAMWEPAATRLGAPPFAAIATDGRPPPNSRVRAVEILTDLFDGLAPDTAAAGARADVPGVRARVAWSLGRAPTPNFVPLLLGLSRDRDPAVRRSALEALAERASEAGEAALDAAFADNVAHPDERVRQSAARLATYLSEAAWQNVWTRAERGSAQARLTTALAHAWRSRAGLNVPVIETAIKVLEEKQPGDLRLQALRLIMLGLGDLNIHKPSVEAYAMYEPAVTLVGDDQMDLAARIRKAVRLVFPSRDAMIDAEAARVLAMLEDNDPTVPLTVIEFFTPSSTISADFHYLTVLSRLQTTLPTNALAKVADAILGLDRKAAGQDQRNKQNWSARLSEVVQNLINQNPALPKALLANPDFVRPAHVALAPLLDAESYVAAAKLFVKAAQKDPQFAWSAQLVDVLASVPSAEVFPLFRQQWSSNLALRDDLTLKLAQNPEPIDRPKFIAGLASRQPQVVQASIAALLRLPRDESAGVLVPALRLLRRLYDEPKARTLRQEIVKLLNHQTGQSFKVEERGADPGNLARAYQPVFAWFAQRNPALLKQLNVQEGTDAAKWEGVLNSVPWDRGNRVIGERLFRERGCQTCHATTSQLGPQLSAAVSRGSPVDLFRAIVFPNREVAPPYQTTVFQLRDGSTYTGAIVFESADGYIVQTGPATTVRLAAGDIASQRLSETSLMPSGLLDGLPPQDLANLYAYLKSL
jgi:putative membrane-bound dehydrogenase-like protein